MDWPGRCRQGAVDFLAAEGNPPFGIGTEDARFGEELQSCLPYPVGQVIIRRDRILQMGPVSARSTTFEKLIIANLPVIFKILFIDRETACPAVLP